MTGSSGFSLVDALDGLGLDAADAHALIVSWANGPAIPEDLAARLRTGAYNVVYPPASTTTVKPAAKSA